MASTAGIISITNHGGIANPTDIITVTNHGTMASTGGIIIIIRDHGVIGDPFPLSA